MTGPLHHERMVSSVRSLIRTIRETPEQATALAAGDFERVVAELLASRGWRVSITPSTRDAVFDIIGITTDTRNKTDIFWAVKCANYGDSARIGIDVIWKVFSLGEKLGMRAMLITTAQFTPEAVRFASSLPREGLELVGREAFDDWIKEYVAPSASTTYSEAQSFESCFVSHSHRDEAFAKTLVSGLRSTGVAVWFAPEDMSPGKKLHEEVRKAIDDFDRFLIIISEHSMESEWVKSELKNARKRELWEGKQIMFPLALVPYDRISKWELFDSDLGHDLAAELRKYLILDFCDWHDLAQFRSKLERVVSALKKCAA